MTEAQCTDPDFKKMYLKTFNEVTDVIAEVQQIEASVQSTLRHLKAIQCEGETLAVAENE